MKLQQNRYLWMYAASLAAVPLLLDLCLAGLASAGPALPYGGQFWAIALLCIPPSLAMQWLRPFYIYSLPPLAIRPAQLSDDYRRCLRLFQSWQVKALAGATAVFAFWLLKQLYLRITFISPVFTPKAGGLIALLAFFLVCALLQVSVSALRALLVGQDALRRVSPYEEDAIARDFLLLGFKVKRILPEDVVAETNRVETPSKVIATKTKSAAIETDDRSTKDIEDEDDIETVTEL